MARIFCGDYGRGRDHLASGYCGRGVYHWSEQGAFRFRSRQLVRLLPPGRRQRLSAAGLTRRIQRLDSRTISLLVRMVVTLGHRHRLVAGKVIDLLDGDSEVQ